ARSGSYLVGDPYALACHRPAEVGPRFPQCRGRGARRSRRRPRTHESRSCADPRRARRARRRPASHRRARVLRGIVVLGDRDSRRHPDRHGEVSAGGGPRAVARAHRRWEMTKGQDVRNLLPLYALGEVTGDEAAAVERALEADPSLAAVLDRYLELVAVTPSADVKARLIASAGGGRFEPFANRIAALFDVTIDRARELLALVERPASWEHPIPGVS